MLSFDMIKNLFVRNPATIPSCFRRSHLPHNMARQRYATKATAESVFRRAFAPLRQFIWQKMTPLYKRLLTGKRHVTWQT
jgi:hypothetical protein